MTTGEFDTCKNDQSALNAFVERASGRLAGIRNGILIFDQDRSSDGDIDVSIRNLQLLRRDALELERVDVVDLADSCENALQLLLVPHPAPSDIMRSLDLVARIEERLLKIPLDADDFLNDIAGFVERSFESLKTETPAAFISAANEDYEIDEEILEIFRSEASDLLHNIEENVQHLTSAADNREALWEIRRNAHTFKGSAGIVGLKAASELAHRIEDLLDKIVESNAVIYSEIVNLLSRSSKRLEVITLGTNFDDEDGPIDSLYAEFERVIAAVPARNRKARLSPDIQIGGQYRSERKQTDSVNPATVPIVRVSLDRLDDLISLSRNLTNSRSALVRQFTELRGSETDNRAGGAFEQLAPLFDAQRRLTDEIQQKLFRIRMVRFGTIETRLSRAVHVTCQEENKKAAIRFENGDCEVDTQIIDALIEPLLHLLKNAVVHGIESEETRRLIGKPEKGDIRIMVDADEFGMTLIVEDDGRGITTSKLKQKALRGGVISTEFAKTMSEREAFDLIFQRGLTTAEKLNLNAGRGVGMSIVKESIESKGGSISVTSEPQKGTTFTIRMPLVLKKTEVRDQSTDVSLSEVKPVEVASKLVLIVDDSASVRRQTTRLVEEFGHRAITANDGAEAMELLLSEVCRPDLIFSDIEMPKMDGWEFLECIKNTKGLTTIPVIVVTSLNGAEHRQRASLLGALDYSVKPISGRDVEKAISTILSPNSD